MNSLIIGIGSKIFSLLKSNFPGYVASILASMSYDTAKSTDFYALRDLLIETVFREFCPLINCEFNETVTASSFYEALSNVKDCSNEDDYILKEVVQETLDTELTINEYVYWLQIFYRTCANPKYQWLLNYIDHDREIFLDQDFILENIRAKLLVSIDNKDDPIPSNSVDRLILRLDNVFQTTAWKDDLLKLMRNATPDSKDEHFPTRLKYLESQQPYDLIQSYAYAMYQDYSWNHKTERKIEEMLKCPRYNKVFLVAGTEGMGKTYFVQRYLCKSVELIPYGQLRTIPILVDVNDLLSGNSLENVLVSYFNKYLCSALSSFRDTVKYLKLYNWSVCCLIDDLHSLGLRNPEKFFNLIQLIKDNSMYEEIFWFLTINTHESYMLADHRTFLERYLISSRRLQVNIPEKNPLLSEAVFPLEYYNQAYRIPQNIL